jgi:hypothetical protein
MNLMKRYFIAIILPFVFAACNNTVEDKNTDSSIGAKDASANNIENAPAITGCYLRVIQRDTLAAFLSQEGNLISGKLAFDNYHKDGSTGTVTGVVHNDILKLVYRFQSEGMTSISEVYFKLTPGGLIHGNGEIKVKGDSAYYADHNNIFYNDKEVLAKIDCNILPEKYR